MKTGFCIGAFGLLVLSHLQAAGEVQGLVLPFKQVSIGSPVDDIIKEVLVEEGDTVEAGQPLARLISEAEQVDVQRTLKLVQKATFDQKAAHTLRSEKMMSEEEALVKEVDLDLANLQHDLALVRLNQKTITSPISGVVVKKYKEAGESVTRIEKCFDIVNIDQVYLQFYVDPVLMPAIQRDATMQARIPILPSPNSSEVKVAFIDPRIDAGSGLFRVKLIQDNADHRIKAGMRCEANFDIFAKSANSGETPKAAFKSGGPRELVTGGDSSDSKRRKIP